MSRSTQPVAEPRRAGDGGRVGWGRAIAVLVLTAAFVLQAVLSMRQKSVTVDEITYVAAGYYHLRTGDFELNMTNPPLMKLLAGLPLLALDPEIPELDGDPSRWNAIEEWQFARRFLYDNRVDADRMLFAARLPFVAMGALLGLLVFAWATQLYGSSAGLLALGLYAFSPNLVAHTRLTNQDLGVTLLVFASAYGFWGYLTRRRLGALGASAVLAGCSLVTKSTAGLIAPIFGLTFLVLCLRSPDFGTDARLPGVGLVPPERPRLRQIATALAIAAIFALASLAVLNLAYGFQGSLSGIPLVPSAFARAIRFQLKLAAHSGGVYFDGTIHEPSLWYILAPTLLLKTPLPSLALGVLAALDLARRRVQREAELIAALTVAIFLAFVLWRSNLGSQLRYVLPIFPFCFVMIGRLVRGGLPRRPFTRAVAALLAVGYVGGTLAVHPHYLAYFNALAGGPANGYRWIGEANLDWGQDLRGLARWMEAQGVERIPLGYFGSADADHYGIEYDYLPSVGLAPRRPGERWWYEMEPGGAAHPLPAGRIAVSVSLVQGAQWVGPLFGSTYRWLLELEPVDTIGHTIHIYEIPERPDEIPAAP